MIVYGEYVQHENLHSKDEVHEWLIDENSKVYSNLENYLSIAETLCNYKDSVARKYGKNINKKRYQNIYAHELTIMLPQNLDADTKCKFVAEYMKSLDYCYSTKYYLYCYKFVNQGEGSYAKVLAFTRKIYKKKYRKLITYTSDHYFDTVNKRRCKKDDLNACLIHKKGEAKLDKDGNKIYQDYYCSPIEKEIFKYSSFSKFLKKLKKHVRYVKMKMLKIYNHQRFFSYVTTSDKISVLSKRKITIKNKAIKNINFALCNVCIGFDEDGNEKYMDRLSFFDERQNVESFDKLFNKQNYLLKRKFYSMIRKIDKIIHSTKWHDPVTGRTLNLSLKQSFTRFNENIHDLEDILIQMIDNWFYENVFDDFNYDIYERSSVTIIDRREGSVC